MIGRASNFFWRVLRQGMRQWPTKRTIRRWLSWLFLHCWWAHTFPNEAGESSCIASPNSWCGPKVVRPPETLNLCGAERKQWCLLDCHIILLLQQTFEVLGLGVPCLLTFSKYIINTSLPYITPIPHYPKFHVSASKRPQGQQIPREPTSSCPAASGGADPLLGRLADATSADSKWSSKVSLKWPKTSWSQFMTREREKIYDWNPIYFQWYVSLNYHKDVSRDFWWILLHIFSFWFVLSTADHWAGI